jgi:fructuronate reductase
MKLNQANLQDGFWQEHQIKTPDYDVEAMVKETKEHPVWLHFGAGNIFRGFIAALQQRLLEQGKAKSGIIASDTFDYDIIDKIYRPYDNLTLFVGLKADGTTENEIIASVADCVKADSSDAAEMRRLKAIFTSPSLQMVSFTITEKGYALADVKGELFAVVKEDIENGPGHARHAMSMVAELLLERFQNGAAPIAMVSMDNCSHNGEKLMSSVLTVARAWKDKGYVTDEFLAYLQDESKVSFPWSMIDKITPRPAKEVEELLEKAGVEEMAPVITAKNTFIAPFVNAEIPQYLVVEDKFPNGRPALEEAGVYMTDRDTVNNTERMKVTTCLNPLHTALAVYGCLLGYTQIFKEMQDEDLKKLVEVIGYKEGLPVVVDPGIIRPKDFIDEVLNERVPNPFMPDTPQRIATDTSQKLPIRFGETIKAYQAREDLDPRDLKLIPLVLAGWCRYLMAVDDEGNKMELSPDPMLDSLCPYVEDIKLGETRSFHKELEPILSNEKIFGVDLYEAGLGTLVEDYFAELVQDHGAVRRTLHKYVTVCQEFLKMSQNK